VFPVASDGVSLLGLPTERSAKRQLSGTAEELIKTISALLDEIVLDVIDKRTEESFLEAFNAAFPNYARLVLSAGKIVKTVVPEQVITRLAADSYCELEAEFRQHGEHAFGAHIRDRALFTVWTLRKISDLFQLLQDRDDKTQPNDDHKETEFLHGFLSHALRARFSLDCLTTSMRLNRPIYREVLGAVDDGLKSTVDAYAWIRQAVDLRVPSSDEQAAFPPSWDEEDEELLRESMSDVAEDED
jgi:hypothetical protein